MIKYFYILVISLCFPTACNTVEEMNADEQIILISGTSFGMCGGYCRNEIQLMEEEVIYKELGWDTVNYPSRTIRGIISLSEWSALVNAIDTSVLRNLNDVYGCPDCADVGAEWIEVYYKDFHKKVTFEYEDTVKPIESLILQLRTLRKRYE